MKLLKLLNYKAIGWTFIYVMLVLITFQIAYGSYSESEPMAGNILMVAGAVFVVIGILLSIKYKPNYILWDE